MNSDTEPDLSRASETADTLRDKLIDAELPGYQVEFDPDEAERAGAFIEDALSEIDALESAFDRA